MVILVYLTNVPFTILRVLRQSWRNAPMAEHDWEELFIKREDVPPHEMFVYAGLDRCRNCRGLRSTVSQPFWYFTPKWPNTVEPACVETS